MRKPLQGASNNAEVLHYQEQNAEECRTPESVVSIDPLYRLNNPSEIDYNASL